MYDSKTEKCMEHLLAAQESAAKQQDGFLVYLIQMALEHLQKLNGVTDEQHDAFLVYLIQMAKEQANEIADIAPIAGTVSSQLEFAQSVVV